MEKSVGGFTILGDAGRWAVSSESLRLGSSPGCELELPAAQPLHARLFRLADRVVLQAHGPIELGGETFESGSRLIATGQVFKVAGQEFSLAWEAPVSEAAGVGLEQSPDDSKASEGEAEGSEMPPTGGVEAAPLASAAEPPGERSSEEPVIEDREPGIPFELENQDSNDSSEEQTGRLSSAEPPMPEEHSAAVPAPVDAELEAQEPESAFVAEALSVPIEALSSSAKLALEDGPEASGPTDTAPQLDSTASQEPTNRTEAPRGEDNAEPSPESTIPAAAPHEEPAKVESASAPTAVEDAPESEQAQEPDFDGAEGAVDLVPGTVFGAPVVDLAEVEDASTGPAVRIVEKSLKPSSREARARGLSSESARRARSPRADSGRQGTAREASEAETRVMASGSRRLGASPPPAAGPWVADSGSEEILDLSSMAIPSRAPERSPLGWILLILVILVSLGLTAFSVMRRQARAARAELEAIRLELEGGGVEGPLRKVKAILAGAPRAELVPELEELRDRLEILALAKDLRPDLKALFERSAQYLQRHKDKQLWTTAELSKSAAEPLLARLSELDKQRLDLQSAADFARFSAALEDLKSLTERADWLQIRERSLFDLKRESIVSALAARQAELSRGSSLTRLQESIKAFLEQRDPNGARSALQAALSEHPEWAQEPQVASLLSAADALEVEILQFRPGFRVNSEAEGQNNIPLIEAQAWRRPLLRRVLKKPPTILDREWPVFLAGSGTLLAFDPYDGRLRWGRLSDADEAPQLIPLEARDTYVCWRRNGEIEVILPDGRTVAKAAVGTELVVPPVVIGTELYAADVDGLLRVLDLETGRWRGSHTLSGRLMGPLGADLGTNRAVAVLENGSLAILRGREGEKTEIVRADFDPTALRVAPLLVRDHLLIFENRPEHDTRLLVLGRSDASQKYSPKREFRLDGWVVRAPSFLNGRVVCSTDSAAVYSYAVNTSDLQAGVTPLYEELAAPRKFEGESLIVAQMVLPNLLYIGGARLERMIIDRSSGWWVTQSRFQVGSELPHWGVIHQPLQVLEDRLVVAGLESEGDGLKLTSLDLQGRGIWQVRCGLPAERAFSESASGLLYREQSGAVFEIKVDEAAGLAALPPVLPPLSEDSASQAGSARWLELAGRRWLLRPGPGASLEAWFEPLPEERAIRAATSSIDTELSGSLSLKWSVKLSARVQGEVLVDEDRVFLCTEDLRLHVLSMKDGGRLAQPLVLEAAPSLSLAFADFEGRREVLLDNGSGALRRIEFDRSQSMLRELGRIAVSESPLAAIASSGPWLWLASSSGETCALALFERKDALVIERGRWQCSGFPMAFAEPKGDGALLVCADRVLALEQGMSAPRLLVEWDQETTVAGRPWLWDSKVCVALSDGRILEAEVARGDAPAEPRVRRMTAPIEQAWGRGSRLIAVIRGGALAWIDLAKDGGR